MTDPQSQMVFVTRALPEPGIGPLQAVGFTVDHRNVDAAATRSELLTGVADADGLLCQVTDRIDAEVLEGASRLRIIANHGVGYDNIDVAAAAERGIVVTNTPGVLTEATADLAWALILGVARRVSEGDRMVRSGSWTAFSPLLLLGKPLAGQTLGVTCMQWALHTTQAGIVTAIIATTPIVLLPMTRIVEGEKIGFRALIGALIAVGGVLGLTFF